MKRLLVMCLLSLPVWAGPVHEATVQGDVAGLKQLLSGQPGLINTPNEKGLVPLVLAVQSGQRDCLLLLLEMGASPNQGSWSALHEASLQGDVESVRLLLARKADPNRREGHNQGTPLHVAAFQGHLEVCRLLLQAGAQVNLKDGERLTPVFHARDQHHPEVLKLLRAAGGK